MRRAKGKAARRGKTGCGGDPQQVALYDWEAQFPEWNASTKTLAECREVIRGACRLYHLEPPRVVQHHRQALSFCIAEYAFVSLEVGAPGRRGGKNIPVALHEAAHYIVFQRHGYRPQDHGPTFLRTLMRLLKWAKLYTWPVRLTARKCGLKW